MEKLIDISSYPVANVLDLLLADKSTKKNIIWATDTYEEFGEGFTDKVQMNANALLRRTDIIRPRIQKSLEAQAQRTRKKAEVFTPAWLCNRMNNHCDEDWFGRTDVFNKENEDHTWTVMGGRIEFPKRKKWQHYVDSRRLEITCGEAPYLVSRYDVSTGELIVPPIRRIGMLDRKLRIVNENTDTYDDWIKWTIRAFEASYGYEYQGDNVLIARINLLLTFMDYYEERWERRPDDKLLEQVANKIVWNIWQMDGLKDTVPLGKPYEEFKQMTLFDMLGVEDEGEDVPEAVPCRIYNWRSNASLKFMDTKEMRVMGKKLFDYVIGNPPYQEDRRGESNTALPVYHDFMEAVYEVGTAVELITPARFLFDAGRTPKAWNSKMLNDEHLKVLEYESDASKIFSMAEIKGGVAITYRDSSKDFGAIGTFTIYEELNDILKRIFPYVKDGNSLASIAFVASKFNTNQLFADYPVYEGHERRMSSNVLSFDCFHSEFSDGDVLIYGVEGGKRTQRYIASKYVDMTDENIPLYKIVTPKADGNGTFGDSLTNPEVLPSNSGFTHTFLGIGGFSTKYEAESCLKYIKTKFARNLLDILKITQDLNAEKWKYVPLQDFTTSSDIDWSKSIHDIDLQLYRKYGLDEKEIDFIETHVKEMA